MLLVKPFIFKPEKPSQTVTEGGFVEIACKLLYGNENNSTVEWKWTKNGTELQSSDRLKIESKETESKLNIAKVGDEDKGVYECHLKNVHGEHLEKINLRVKSKFCCILSNRHYVIFKHIRKHRVVCLLIDALAALWPFLGIVAEVALLCLIILIYEKKCAKRPSNNEDETEQSQNLYIFCL
jgi:hypothetical protein